MNHLSRSLRAIRRLDNRGVAAIEYALIASLITLALVAGFANLGGAVTNQFNEVDNGVAAGTQFRH